MGWKAVGDKVIVRKAPAEEDSVSAGGIYLVESAAEKMDKTSKATVVAVGNGRKEDGTIEEIPLKEGDVILYHKNFGTDISGLLPTDDDRDLMVLHTQDILAVVEPG